MTTYTTKAEEALAESSHQHAQEHEDTLPPPSYAPASSSDSSTPNPPTYDSLTAIMHQNMSSLSTGDPSETISVPMISRSQASRRYNLNPFSRSGGLGKINQTVTVRKMKREQYLRHYAKDAEGNFVGTGHPAPDAGLVFVPGKSTPEELMRQVEEVAFGRQEVRGKGIFNKEGGGEGEFQAFGRGKGRGV